MAQPTSAARTTTDNVVTYYSSDGTVFYTLSGAADSSRPVIDSNPGDMTFSSPPGEIGAENRAGTSRYNFSIYANRDQGLAALARKVTDVIPSDIAAAETAWNTAAAAINDWNAAHPSDTVSQLGNFIYSFQDVIQGASAYSIVDPANRNHIIATIPQRRQFFDPQELPALSHSYTLNAPWLDQVAPGNADAASDTPAPWDAFRNFGNADRGLVTRAHGGLVVTSLVPPAAYPATSDDRVDRWPKDWREWSSFLANKQEYVTADINFGGGTMRGFAYCGANLRPTAEQEASLKPIAQKPKAFRVDGQDVLSNGRDFTVGDTWIFDRDQSVFINNWLYLESTRGDV
jgi:hypothetical protein